MDIDVAARTARKTVAALIRCVLIRACIGLDPCTYTLKGHAVKVESDSATTSRLDVTFLANGADFEEAFCDRSSLRHLPVIAVNILKFWAVETRYFATIASLASKGSSSAKVVGTLGHDRLATCPQ